MKNTIFKSLFIAAIAIVLVSCKKKKEEMPTPILIPATPIVPIDTTIKTQMLSLSIANMANGKPADFSSIFTTSTGVRYKIESLRYYISNIRLVKADGSELPIKDKYLLVNPAMVNYPLGAVPVGDYKGIRFGVGVDSAANHADNTKYPTTHPLAMQSPSIYWSWKSGYIFMMFEGNCDTTDTQTDVLTYNQFSKSFFYHIGMDMLYSQVDLSTSAFSVGNVPKEIKLEANLDNFFTNIDLKKENMTHSMGAGAPLAIKAKGNIPTMFSIK
jgi:hypothetical protein